MGSRLDPLETPLRSGAYREPAGPTVQASAKAVTGPVQGLPYEQESHQADDPHQNFSPSSSSRLLAPGMNEKLLHLISVAVVSTPSLLVYLR